jgi:hypothetical protein
MWVFVDIKIFHAIHLWFLPQSDTFVFNRKERKDFYKLFNFRKGRKALRS